MNMENNFSVLVEDFKRRWDAGERPLAESVISRLDSIYPYQAAELIFHEYCRARDAGLGVDPASYLKRFPEYQELLARLFSLDQDSIPADLQSWACFAEMPRVGGQVGHFKLRRLLGKGSFASVFLAERGDLSDSLCVLKISSRITTEPHLLARLKHVNIIDVIRQVRTEDGLMQLICMPFYGGATLADVAREMRSRQRPRTGKDLLGILDAVAAPEFDHADARQLSRDLIAKMSAPKAIAWIIARIAEALDHANRRGVNHGDIKLSNILIGGDGVPRLFDFNLSRDRWDLPPGDASTVDIGGTIVYMPPERLDSIRRGKRYDSFCRDLHLRSDLYALGLIILELLTNLDLAKQTNSPFGFLGCVVKLYEIRSGPSAFARLLKQIPSGLRPILERLLQADPIDRYATGRELAADLDEWIEDRPPKFAAHPGIHVSAVNSLKRQAKRLVFIALLLGPAAAVYLWHSHVRETEAGAKLYDAWISERRNEQDIARWLPVAGERESESDFDIRDNELLAMTAAAHPAKQYGYRKLDARRREELDAIVAERVLILAQRLSLPNYSEGDWRNALALIDWVPSSRSLNALASLRRAIERQLGLPPRVRTPLDSEEVAPGWLNDYLDGVGKSPSHAREARLCFERVLAAKENFFWALHRIASLDFRLGDFDHAQKMMRTCIDQRGLDPVLRTQMATILLRLGPRYYSEAEAQCVKAVSYDRTNNEVGMLLALVQLLANRGESAVIEELTKFGRNRRNEDQSEIPLQVARTKIRYAYLLGLRRLSLDQSLLNQLVQSYPKEQSIRIALAASLARDGFQNKDQRKLNDAIQHYEIAIQRNKENIFAVYSLAMVLERDGKLNQASDLYRKLANHDRFEELCRDVSDPFRCLSVVVRYDYYQRDWKKGIETAGRWLALATLRNMKGPAAGALCFRALGWANASADNADLLQRSAEDLREAARIDPAAFRTLYTQYEGFDPFRAQLDRLLASSPTSSPR